MLVGSVGVTVNRHFCMGELKSLALFGSSVDCAMDHAAPVADCPMHGATQAKKKGCCDDRHEFVKWDDDRQADTPPALPAWNAPGPLPPALYPSAPHPRTAALRAFENYRPPPLVIDVPSRWQVFRL